MSSITHPPSSPYDEIAGLYHAQWADWYLPAAMPALENLFFSHVAPGARVLDVCCGSGHVTAELVSRGYNVTGFDASRELIALARREMPGVDLRLADARAFDFETQYDAAISTFDSLNHLLSLDDLHAAFRCVHGALSPHGLFVFDMNLEAAYGVDLEQWMVKMADNEVSLARGVYDFATRKATTELIWFIRDRGDDNWRRQRSLVEERCYDRAEILTTLVQAGFREIESFNARDAGVTAELGFGRIFVTARA